MTLARPELAVIIPVYNEEDIIEKVLEDWSNEFRRLGIDFEMHVYDDGSNDNTKRILNEYGSKSRNIAVHSKTNTGHGPTILLGYREYSHAKWIFQIDSDYEIGAEHFQEFWEKRNTFDFLIGCRIDRKGAVSRRLISSAARIIVRILYGGGVSDVNCPYRLMRTDLFRDTFSKMDIGTYAPNVIISAIACKRNYRILEMPVTYYQRTTGEVSIRRWKLLKAALISLWQTIKFPFRMDTN